MNTTFPFKHWLTSLAIAPFLLAGFLYDFFDQSSAIDVLETYVLFLVFSAFLSLPVFICNFFVFYILKKKNTKPLRIKFTLLIMTIIGIVITLNLIGGELTNAFTIGYSIATIVSILPFKIYNDKIEILEYTQNE